MGWKPGHYLLLAVSLYALVVTFAFSLRGRQVAALRQEAMAYRERAAWAPEGYMLRSEEHTSELQSHVRSRMPSSA